MKRLCELSVSTVRSRIPAFSRYPQHTLELMVEIEGEGPQPPLPHDGANLVAFMSFAVMRGFGAQHPFIALAERLHGAHRVSLGPFTTFYEARIDDAEDAAKLEHAWQDLSPLHASAVAIARALEGDPQCQALVRRAAADGLADEVAALAAILSGCEDPNARVRLSYRL